ncbi:MAG: cardiolipin synthase [Planctomycetota bacterium]|nr:MAG: cardiolipin synthase [Planctomycetota bacterium]
MTATVIAWLPTAYLVSEWVIRIAMTPVVVRRRPPTNALAWLAIVYFLPWAGLVAYALVGERRLGRLRLRRRREAAHACRARGLSRAAQQYVIRPAVAPEQDDLVMLTERLSGLPVQGGNAVGYEADTDRAVDKLITDLDAAADHAHLLFYIMRADGTGRRVADALTRAAQRGVRVRVLLDAVGAEPALRVLAPTLRRAGVEVAAALPAGVLRQWFRRLDLRNHRKLAVIDGRVAHTGSQNLVDADYGGRRAGPWRDLMVRIEGPAVATLQAVFLEDWFAETGRLPDEPGLFPRPEARGPTAVQPVPSGPDDPRDTFRSVVIASLYEAQRRVIITTPYFVPDDGVVQAMRLNALRGVRIDLVVPRRCDHVLAGAAAAARYGDLLDAGVTVHQHGAGLLHAKTMSVDDAFALVGSGNLDSRSFFLNFELSLILYGAEATGRLRAAQEAYIAESAALSRRAWAQQPAWKQTARSIAALAGPLL